MLFKELTFKMSVLKDLIFAALKSRYYNVLLTIYTPCEILVSLQRLLGFLTFIISFNAEVHLCDK